MARMDADRIAKVILRLEASTKAMEDLTEATFRITKSDIVGEVEKLLAKKLAEVKIERIIAGALRSVVLDVVAEVMATKGEIPGSKYLPQLLRFTTC
jgi:hypothetical protein